MKEKKNTKVEWRKDSHLVWCSKTGALMCKKISATINSWNSTSKRNKKTRNLQFHDLLFFNSSSPKSPTFLRPQTFVFTPLSPFSTQTLFLYLLTSRFQYSLFLIFFSFFSTSRPVYSGVKNTLIYIYPLGKFVLENSDLKPQIQTVRSFDRTVQIYLRVYIYI